ncbi:MAG: discoidin domain-containing protein [Kiritimatiellia bacterium]
MKNATIWIGSFLLGTGMAFGQATLPTFYSGPWTTLPSGWTKQGTGTYATDYDGGGGASAKFDGAGDWIKIYFTGAPSTVSYWLKGNSLSGEYSYKVQESANGSTWTDVASYGSANPINNSTPVQYTNNLLSASRYVQFIYVTKAVGNVGLDGVTIAGPGVPSVSFNPNGTTNAPVSNLFTMAVSISPSGAGMQSWNMAPAYSGPASLSGGTFSFTPASVDNGKTFTVSVIATNSIGTTTGTATVVVTPYVPPSPVISFFPAAPYNIMATYTQKLGIGVVPAGSGIQSWTLLPSNYAGSATLVGTNFTFITAEADGDETYTLAVIATNAFPPTTGTASIAVSEYVPPPPPSAYICTFEDGTKTGYASGDVTLSNKVWNLTGILIGTDANDLKIGSKAARLKYNTSDGEETMTIQSAVMSNGISTISLWYGPYGTHGASAPTLAIEISESLFSGWMQVGEVACGAVTALTYYSCDVYVSTPLYVRIRATSGTTDKSANFDNVTIAPYVAPSRTPYDAFLLKYNVTPGDPGTAPDDDLDGDLITNTNEFIADTNPYDETDP